MYDEAKTWVRKVRKDLENFLEEIGLHQASMLNPFLFVLVMDELTRHIQVEMP